MKNSICNLKTKNYIHTKIFGHNEILISMNLKSIQAVSKETRQVPYSVHEIFLQNFLNPLMFDQRIHIMIFMEAFNTLFFLNTVGTTHELTQDRKSHTSWINKNIFYSCRPEPHLYNKSCQSEIMLRCDIHMIFYSVNKHAL